VCHDHESLLTVLLPFAAATTKLWLERKSKRDAKRRFE